MDIRETRASEHLNISSSAKLNNKDMRITPTLGYQVVLGTTIPYQRNKNGKKKRMGQRYRVYNVAREHPPHSTVYCGEGRAKTSRNRIGFYALD